MVDNNLVYLTEKYNEAINCENPDEKRKKENLL